MIQLNRPPLSQAADWALAGYQSVVDAQAGFIAQSVFAKADFSKKNKSGNPTFDEIKAHLLQMCSGAERCHYCEDSKADEVEHLLPKQIYPDFCYVWANYLYACGPCNQSKGNQCAVIQTNGTFLNITPAKGTPPSPPPSASLWAIINPILENPLDFLVLDLHNTFHLVELADEGTLDFERAKFTKDALKLNRTFLATSRRKAFQNYRARLREYISERDSGNASPQELQAMISGIQEEAHPTVWQEMKRQQAQIPTLAALFGQAPEALAW